MMAEQGQSFGEEKVNKLRVNLQLVVTQEDIDDIMASALEGGINYWCEEVDVVGKYRGEYASEQIGRNGALILYDTMGSGIKSLTKEKLLHGIQMYVEHPTHPEYGDPFEVVGHELHIDCGRVDAEVADSIIQYAVFSGIVYRQ